MVLIGEKGFNLKGSLRADRLADKAIFSGKHTQDDAFLLIRGLSNKSVVPDVPTVADVKSIMESCNL